MTLNASGPISLAGDTAGESVNIELGKSATSTISLNDVDVRTLAGVGSGTISLYDFYGKSTYVYGQEEFSTAGTYLWTCPADVTSVAVVCVGAGGGGASRLPALYGLVQAPNKPSTEENVGTVPPCTGFHIPDSLTNTVSTSFHTP